MARHSSTTGGVPCRKIGLGHATRYVTRGSRSNVLRRTSETTEVYYILEGTGKIELNGDWHDLEPGTTVWIEPGTRHRVVSAAGLKTIVVALPAFDAADEWFD